MIYFQTRETHMAQRIWRERFRMLASSQTEQSQLNQTTNFVAHRRIGRAHDPIPINGISRGMPRPALTIELCQVVRVTFSSVEQHRDRVVAVERVHPAEVYSLRDRLSAASVFLPSLLWNSNGYLIRATRITSIAINVDEATSIPSIVAIRLKNCITSALCPYLANASCGFF